VFAEVTDHAVRMEAAGTAPVVALRIALGGRTRADILAYARYLGVGVSRTQPKALLVNCLAPLPRAFRPARPETRP